MSPMIRTLGIASIAVAASFSLATPALAQDEESEWSFDVFGRVQADFGTIEAPDGVVDPDPGWESEFRRARIGVSGESEGGLGFKVEVDFAPSDPEVTDAYISYKTGGLTLTLGQHNNFQSLEELTSSRFISFIERAAFTDAFGFERRAGISAQYHKDALLVQAGVFTDNVHDMDDGENNWGVDGRVVYAPKSGDTQIHVGGSVHYRNLDNTGGSIRYRQRPHFHFTSLRYINTGSFTAESEFGVGLEGAVISGPFHAAAEAYWQHASLPGMDNPTFFGGYAEAGFFLTPGDTRGYKSFKFDRVKPRKELLKGGIGAVQVNVRYDYLNLNSGTIIGGKQNGVAASLIWTPSANTRFMLDYGHMSYHDAAIVAASGTDYGVDTFGMRAQFDF